MTLAVAPSTLRAAAMAYQVPPEEMPAAARGWHLALLLLALLAVFVPGGAAEAGCTDPPAPGVNWQRCALDRLDLSGVDLTGARLRDATFFRADLSNAVLTEANGFRAKFVNTDLTGARLDSANLAEADMTKADLTGASLVEAELGRARLFQANLRNADLTGAEMRDTDLTEAELSGATWTDGKTVCAEGSVGRCNWR